MGAGFLGAETIINGQSRGHRARSGEPSVRSPVSTTPTLDQYDDIETQAVVLDAVRVVLRLPPCIFHRRAIVVADLGPAGHARLDAATRREGLNIRVMADTSAP